MIWILNFCPIFNLISININLQQISIVNIDLIEILISRYHLTISLKKSERRKNKKLKMMKYKIMLLLHTSLAASVSIRYESFAYIYEVKQVVERCGIISASLSFSMAQKWKRKRERDVKKKLLNLKWLWKWEKKNFIENDHEIAFATHCST